MAANTQLSFQPPSQIKDGEKRLALIVGSGRSGTNHLVRLLRRIPNVSSRGEPFNQNAAWGLNENDIEQLATWSGTPFANRRDPLLKDLLARKPAACLEQMLRILPPDKTVLIVKVLTDQLSAKQIETLATSGFLASSVIVRRRLLDSFISLKKAMMLSSWLNKDTTGVQTTLTVDAFKVYLERHQQWHTQVAAALRSHRIPLGVMEYETDIDCDWDECVRKFILAAGEHLFESVGTTGPEGLAKQDRSERIEDKVANWPEFSRELRESGLFEKAMSSLDI